MDDTVVSKKIMDNHTWNTCPDCLKHWRDKINTPGILHRTKQCNKCFRKWINERTAKRNG